MDLDADPAVLARTAARLGALADELAAAAHRVGALGRGEGQTPPGDWSRRRAALVEGLRSDSAELLAGAELLRQDGAGLLAAEERAVIAVARADRRRSGQPGWVR